MDRRQFIHDVLYGSGLIGGSQLWLPDQNIWSPGFAHTTAPDDWFVDPVGGNDTTGTGAIGAPWKTVQKALDTCTRNATSGDRINVKSTGDDVLGASLSLATYGSPAYSASLYIQGYDSAQGDGGVGGIDGDGSYSIAPWGAYDGIFFTDMHLHNCGANPVVSVNRFSGVFQCEIDGGTNGFVITNASAYGAAAGCYFHNLSGYGVSSQYYDVIWGNYFQNGASDFTHAIYNNGIGGMIGRNIFSLDGASNGIYVTSSGNHTLICQNSVLSSAGTGNGIALLKNPGYGFKIFGNLVEGFSGAGGNGYYAAGNGYVWNIAAWNYAYNNTTNFSGFPDDETGFARANTALGASPFAKTGADTFANRFAYFAPAAAVQDKVFV